MDENQLKAKLFEQINAAQSVFIESNDIVRTMEYFLSILLKYTKSEYAFFGEILEQDTLPYLKIIAIKDLGLDLKNSDFFMKYASAGLEFHNMNSLLGVPVLSGKYLISNDPANDPQKSGLPQGHPPMSSFMALPVMIGEKIGGLFGVANCPTGYKTKMATFFNPLLISAGLLLQRYRINKMKLQIEEEMNDTRIQLEAVLENMVDALVIIDHKGNIQSINSSLTGMLGYEFQELKGKNVKLLMPDPYRSEHDEYIRKYLETGIPKIIGKGREVLAMKKNGERVPVYLSVGNVRVKNRRLFVGILHDITEKKNQERESIQFRNELEALNQRLLQLSIIDELTSLYNRRFFSTRFREDFNRAKKSRSPISLIIFDVDYFKKFNDSCGHTEGDYCLQAVALAAKKSFHASEHVVARYGGEEFIVILPDCDEHTATVHAENLRVNIEKMGIPHPASNVSPYVTVSIGVAGQIPEEEDSDHLIRLADKALYYSKEQGRNMISGSSQVQ